MSQRTDADQLLYALCEAKHLKWEDHRIDNSPQYGGAVIVKADGSRPWGETRRPLVELNRTLRFTLSVLGDYRH